MRRFVAQSYTGWTNAREGGPVKTEDDPFDAQPVKAQTETMAAIQFVEKAVLDAPVEGLVLRYGNFYGPGASESLLELVRARQMPLVGNGAGVWSWRESLRPLLFSIAYRMLASVSDAEDIVQDTYLRYQHGLAEGTAIESLKSYLCATVTRLAIDQLRSARARRETYVGEWLPEPVVTDGAPSDGDPAADTERAESISMAFLLLLERLRPIERAVFLLHDVFAYSFQEIACIVGKSEDNCRQLALRARKRVEAGRPRFDPDRQQR